MIDDQEDKQNKKDSIICCMSCRPITFEKNKNLAKDMICHQNYEDDKKQ